MESEMLGPRRPGVKPRDRVVSPREPCSEHSHPNIKKTRPRRHIRREIRDAELMRKQSYDNFNF